MASQSLRRQFSLERSIEPTQRPFLYFSDLGCSPSAPLSSRASGVLDGGWIGFNLRRMQYFFYVHLGAPEILIFEAYDAPVDPDKHDDVTGHVFWRFKGWRWRIELDIASGDVDFFSQSKADQESILVDFIKKSHAIARTLE